MADRMQQQDKEMQKSRRQMALMMVYGLPVVLVMDFLLAYKGGQWLDVFYATGSNLWRNVCLVLALMTAFLTLVRLINLGSAPKNEK